MQFLVENSMYVSLIVAAMILIGLLVYMARVDARLRKLEREDPSLTSRRSD